MRFIGIDVGASFIKGAVLDPGQERVERVARRPFPAFTPGLPKLYREVPITPILLAVREVAEELAQLAPDCGGLLVCGQMHGAAFVSEHGETISNFISWQDQRARLLAPGRDISCMQALLELVPPAVRQTTGNELTRQGTTLSILFAMRMLGQSWNRDAVVCSLPDCIVAGLCGSAPVTEPTNAAGCGFMHLEQGTWHLELLQSLGLGDVRPACIVPTCTQAGTVVLAGKEIPCYVAIGDQQAALLGADLQTDELSLNIATGSQVSLLAQDPQAGEYQVRPFFGGRYLRTITHLPAGRSLNLLMRMFTELSGDEDNDVLSSQTWTRLERLAVAAGDSDLSVDLSFYTTALGELGSICNIREDNFSAGGLFRASLQSMAHNYYKCACRLSPQRTWHRIAFSGGLIQKSALLRKCIMDRFECPSRISADVDETLMGLMRMARESLIHSGGAPNTEVG